MILNREMPVPLYYQIYKMLESELSSDRFKPGDRYSTEAELQTRFDVSRATIRKALELLESNGFVFRVTGKGIFAAPVKLRIDLPELISFSEEMMRRGMKPSSKLLDIGWTEAAAAVNRGLQLGEGCETLLIRRIRFGDETPIVYSEAYVPRELGMTEKDDFGGSLYELIHIRTGRKVEDAHHIIEGAVADEETAGFLQIVEGFPCLRFRRTAYDSQGLPIVYEWGLARADHYSYEIKLKGTRS